MLQADGIEARRSEVVLTPAEFARPDHEALAREKLRLQLGGVPPNELTDLASWHKQHPEVPLAVAV